MSGETDLHALSARSGDPQAFTTLYERVAPALVVWSDVRLHGPLRRRHDPEDLLQEVWWKALDNFQSFDPARGSFRAWMFGIANNVFLGMVKRVGSKNPAIRNSDSLPPEVGAELTSITTRARRNEAAQKLADFARTLPDDEVEIFIRCGLESTMVKEVAPLVGASTAAVNKKWQRMRQRIRERSIWDEFLEEDA